MSTNYFKEFTPKLFTLLKNKIPARQIGTDIVAGLIVGIIALPLAIAFAIASGVSPEQGIITAIIGGLIVSAFGGSRVQIAGPTGAFIVIVYGIIAKYGITGLYISTFIAGILLILMGLFKLGLLLRYIPQTLITGFTSAIALIIFSTQIKDFLGLNIDNLPSKFLSKWVVYFKSLNMINFWSLGIGLLTIFIIAFLPKLFRNNKIPWAFVAILFTSCLTALFRIPIETIFTRFGNIDFVMPNITFFSIDWNILKQLIFPAISIAILGALESLLSAVVADGSIGGNHRSNMELVAQGAANIVSPMLGGIPITGAIARTAANIANGGRTPIAGIVHALFLLFVYVVAMPVIKYIPMATLAGILIVVAWKMSDIRTFINSLKINYYESIVLLATFTLTILTDLTIAIPIGFVLATILFMKRMADSIEIIPLLAIKTDHDTLFSHEIGEYPQNIMIFELNGPMFFASAHKFFNLLSASNQIIILRFRYVPIMDASALARLKTLSRDFKKKNCELIVSGANAKISKKLITHGIVTTDNIFPSIAEALDSARRRSG